MKKIAILGSTGSIGTQALDIIEKNPDKYKVTVLSCGKRTELCLNKLIDLNLKWRLLQKKVRQLSFLKSIQIQRLFTEMMV